MGKISPLGFVYKKKKKKTVSDVRSEEPSKISAIARTFGKRFYGRYRSAPLGYLQASEHKVANVIGGLSSQIF